MLIIFIIMFVLLIINPNISKNAIFESTSLWFSTLVPVLFPSLVITELINNEIMLDKLCKILYKPFKFIFNIYCPKSVYLIIISILCGSPTNAKIVKLTTENNEVNSNEARLILDIFSTTSLAYTIYILKTNNINLLLYFLISISINSILMHIFNKPYQEDITINNKIYKKRIEVLISSIKSSISVLFSILGIIIFFNILISIFFSKDIFIYPYLELMGGLNYIEKKGLGTFSIVSSISFLSLSIHLQIVANYIEISYWRFLLIRLISTLITVFIFLLFG